jgi:hypothetical protein
MKQKLGKRVIVLTATNAVAQVIRKKWKIAAMTLWEFNGIDADDNAAGKSHNPADYDIIVFDEIFQHKISNLTMISRMVSENHGRVQFLANGDVFQNRAIQPMSKFIDYWSYYTNAIRSIFPNQLNLSIIKRQDMTEEQKIKFMKICNILRDRKTEIKELAELFKVITSAEALKLTDRVHITYHKKTRDKIIDATWDGKYYIGQELLARKTVKNKGIYCNATYNITKIENDHIYLNDIKMSMKTARNKETGAFPAIARTNHSIQGLTAGDKIAIWNINSPYVDKEWIRTAITRASTLDVLIVDDNIEEKKRRKYFRRKIEGYRGQDHLANRPWTEKEYITIEWIEQEFKKYNARCSKCCEGLSYDDFTVDRISNNISHIKTNCRLMCKQCNSGTHHADNRISSDYQWFREYIGAN